MNAALVQSLSLPGRLVQPSGESPKLASRWPALDQFLQGGLPWGRLVEWGLPRGKQGWHLLLPFVVQASQEGHCFWIGQDPQRQPFAPHWTALGVRPETMHFVQSPRPLLELKEIFSHRLPRLILLDNPSGLKGEDLAYLSAQARQGGKLILLVRGYFLSQRQGNIWAALRINAWKRNPGGPWMLRCLKGPPGELQLKEGAP